MRIDIITIFPKMFESPFQEGVIRIAQEKKIISINIYNLRDFAKDKHKTTDDYPYGGGPGMVMKPEPIFKAVRSLDSKMSKKILLSPQGERYDQTIVKELIKEKHLILICGRYKDVDERVREHLVDMEISIGDYVLSGGELAAMVIVDSVVRLLPGVISDIDSAIEDSFHSGLLDYPHYTRPREFEGMGVPDVLLSGDHQKIRRWRRKEMLRRTLLKRAKLLDKIIFSDEDRELLEEIRKGV